MLERGPLPALPMRFRGHILIICDCGECDIRTVSSRYFWPCGRREEERGVRGQRRTAKSHVSRLLTPTTTSSRYLDKIMATRLVRGALLTADQ